MHGTVRSLFQLLGAVGVTVLILLAWISFRLSEGPLNLSFVTPYVQDALSNPDKGLAVSLARTVLVWDRQARTLQIRATDAKLTTGGQGVLAEVPELSFSLSAPALLHGVVALRSVSLIHPTIHLRRDATGRVELGLGQSSGSSAGLDDTLQALLKPPGGETTAGNLHRIDVLDAELVVQDDSLGTRWQVPHTNFGLVRDREGIEGHANLELALGDGTVRLDGQASYRMDSRAVDARLAFAGLHPAALASLAPQIPELMAFQLPVAGSIALRYELDRGPRDVQFELSGGPGTIDLSSRLGVVWPVASLALRGGMGEGLDRLSIDELRLDLGGPTVVLSAQAEGLAPRLGLSPDPVPLALRAEARAEGMPVDSLKNLWPAELAANPRRWIVANLTQGIVRLATAELAAHLPAGRPPDEIVVDRLEGEVVPEGVTVNYLSPMPPARRVSGRATYNADTFTIAIKGGELMGLRVPEGKVILGGLSAEDQFADIALTINGPLADALRVIDSKPLGWAQSLGLQPAKVGGEAGTSLTLQFPLLQNLGLNQIKVRADAQIRRLAMPGVAFGLDLSEGAVSLGVDAKGMDLAGTAQMGGLPVELKWRENFVKAAPFRRRYQVAGSLDDEGRRKIGLDTEPFQPPYLTGPVPVEAVATMNDGGQGEVEVAANLTPSTMELPGLNWDKPAGVVGRATATLRLKGGRLDEVPRFSVEVANGLAIDGRVGFVAGRARDVDFDTAKWGHTDVKGRLTIRPEGKGLAIDLTGPSLDARELVSGRASDHSTDKAVPRVGQSRPEKKKEPPRREEKLPLEVRARLAEVWISDQGTARNVTANLSRDRREWQEVRIDAEMGRKPFRLEIHPAGPSRRNLKIEAADAGAVFRGFDVFENVVGGKLLVDSHYDDADPWQPLSGLATVSDYSVIKAPALARLLTVAALTGIVEVLTGQGIHFSTLEAPFTLTDGVLEVRDARAAGPALGITAKGQVDLEYDLLALEGTVVPIYVLNSMLGQIPVLGQVFSGEKGGGIVAMNYSMKGPAGDPRVTVNPFSALTPGFLRKLFDIFDKPGDTEVRPDSPNG